MDLLLFLVQSNLICLHFPFNLIVLAFGFYLFVFVSQNIQRIFPQKYAEKHNQWNRIFANCQLFHAVQSISIRFIFVKYFFFILIRNLMQSTLVLSVIFCVFFVLNVNVMWKFVFATLLAFLIKYRKKNRYRQFSYIQIWINHFVSFIFHGNIIYTNLLLLEWGKKILEILWNLNYS